MLVQKECRKKLFFWQRWLLASNFLFKKKLGKRPAPTETVCSKLKWCKDERERESKKHLKLSLFLLLLLLLFGTGLQFGLQLSRKADPDMAQAVSQTFLSSFFCVCYVCNKGGQEEVWKKGGWMKKKYYIYIKIIQGMHCVLSLKNLKEWFATQPPMVVRKKKVQSEYVHVASTFLHVWRRFVCCSRCLLTKCSASELCRKVIKDTLLVGCGSWWQFLHFRHRTNIN